MEKLTMEKLVAFCKQYGYVFQGSEIYGGLANTWDYGPLGSRLKIILKMRGERDLYRNEKMHMNLMLRY